MNGRIYFWALVFTGGVGLILLWTPCTLAQNGGFTETFDNPALPGWEQSPNVAVINGALRIEPGGFAFRPGQWSDFILIIRAKYNGEGRAIISYRAGETGEYALRLHAGFIDLSRLGQKLGGASHEIPPDEWAAIEIVSSGGSQAIKLNGRAVISATDSDPLILGGLFLRADIAAAEFDDLTISPALSTRPPAYQAKSWVALGGPPGDLGYDIRYNFDDPNIWYVTDAQGGFFISTDRGQTWKPSNKGIASLEGTMNRPVFSATVDPHNPQTIWIGTQVTGHIYKSTDGGRTWKPVNNGLPQPYPPIVTMALNPTSPDTIFIGGRTGVFKTIDGGNSWVQLAAGLDPVAEVLAIVIDPSNRQNVYVGSSRQGVSYSTDGGNMFQRLRQGLDPEEGAMPVLSLAISADGTVLYAGTAGQGVWRLGTPAESPP